MKKLLLSAVFALATFGAWAQAPLRFHANGTFKILQLTDIHVRSERPETAAELDLIDELIGREKPDLVVITGDMAFSRPAGDALRRVMERVSKHGVPFCTVWGNHDAEFDLSKNEMYDLIRSFPGCMMPDRGGADSPDYALEILSSDGKKPAAVLYLIDSNDSVFDADRKWLGYDWIHIDQIAWYTKVSAGYTAGNGGTPLPSLAFFHIPLPEFRTAATTESAVLVGTRMEPSCPPDFNSGFFKAFKQRGDIFACFVGHDHDNDYAVAWEDVLLAYGRFSGCNTVYNHLPAGGRTILLEEGRKALESYIILKGGEVINRIRFPESFTK